MLHQYSTLPHDKRSVHDAGVAGVIVEHSLATDVRSAEVEPVT